MTISKVLAALGCCAALMGARCGTPGDPSPSMSRAFNVMTFNIRYGTADDGQDAWSNRRALLFDVVRHDQPELIGFQEALHFQLEEIRRAEPHLAIIGVGRDDGREAGEYAAIAYRADRFRVERSGTFWFSDTPDVPGSRSWGNNVTRICTWARLQHYATLRHLWVFNVHLDHESQPSRERSVALLLERIRARGDSEPVLVTGDFNAGEDNPAVHAMAAVLHDTYRVMHPADTAVGTFHAFRGGRGGAKIDYIFVSGEFDVRAAAIDTTARRGRYPSDHFPVTARVGL